jgi:hypothetical protein
MADELGADNMPTIEQISNYLKYRRLKLGNSNNINGVEDFVRNHTYHPNYDSNKLFVFGVHLGTGTDDDHFYLGFTTLNLLKRIEQSNRLYHIDATYKIIKYFFPLIIFGFTDRSRKFYVVAYTFVSHEQEIDYNHFFTSLLKITGDLNIVLDIEYLVQDAWTATSNAACQMFDGLVIIMCWFHVMFNVKKHKSLVPDSLFEDIVSDIHDLHYCLNEVVFNSLKRSTLKKWRNNEHLVEFAEYFENQWL